MEKKKLSRCVQLWNVTLDISTELSHQTLIICTRSAPAAISKAKRVAKNKWAGKFRLITVTDAGTIDSF